jgi:hypothetical protein
VFADRPLDVNAHARRATRAATLPPGHLEGDVLVAWTCLQRAAAMLPAASDHEREYHRQLREQFEVTDDDYSAELEKLTRELGATVVVLR